MVDQLSAELKDRRKKLIEDRKGNQRFHNQFIYLGFQEIKPIEISCIPIHYC